MPAPVLDHAEASARQQMVDARTRLETLLAEPRSAANELARAFADLGLLYVVYDFLEPAGASFANARALAPDDYRWHYLGGYQAGLAGDLAKAVTHYQRALELQPRDPTTLLRLARIRLEQGEDEEARRHFERALELDPASPAALEGLGRLAASSGDAATAATYFERALVLEPEASALHYALSQVYRLRGDLERAAEQLDLAGDVPTRIPDPLIAPLAEVAESTQFYLMQGAEAVEDEDFETAATAYTAALERDPRSFKAYQGLASSLQRLGDLEGAVATLERALRGATTGDPREDRALRADVLRRLGSLDALAGREDRALERFEAALSLEPDQPAALMRVANALARRGRLVDALAIYDRLLELVPESAPAVLEKRAVVLVNLRRDQEAIAAFERALVATPGDPALRARFVDALDYLGHHERAAAERAALRQLEGTAGPANADRLLQEAFRLREEGDTDQAIERYRRALELVPERSDVRFGLASLLLETHRLEPAAEEFARLLEHNPRHAAARRGLILAHVLDQRYTTARSELQEALRLFPRDRELALIQVRLLASAPDERARNGALALEIARRVHADDDSDATREALALACAAAGVYTEAVSLQRALVADAEGARQTDLAEARRARLEAFERSEPWQARSPAELLGDDHP